MTIFFGNVKFTKLYEKKLWEIPVNVLPLLNSNSLMKERKKLVSFISSHYSCRISLYTFNKLVRVNCQFLLFQILFLLKDLGPSCFHKRQGVWDCTVPLTLQPRVYTTIAARDLELV